MYSSYTLHDLRDEMTRAASTHRPCPNCGASRWRARILDSGVQIAAPHSAASLYVALACRACKAHDAARVAI